MACARLLGGGAAGRAQARRIREDEGETWWRRARLGGGAAGRSKLGFFFLRSSFPGDADEAEREREAAEVVERAERGEGGREREGFFSRGIGVFFLKIGGVELRKTKCRRFCFIENLTFRCDIVAPERSIRCD